jgi:hypothetical protein
MSKCLHHTSQEIIEQAVQCNLTVIIVTDRYDTTYTVTKHDRILLEGTSLLGIEMYLMEHGLWKGM